MKKTLIALIVSSAPAGFLFAAADGNFDEYASTFFILDSYTLWSAIIVASAASLLVFLNARAMRGGIFGISLVYFGTGMLLAFLGFLAPSLGVIEESGFASTVNNALFIAGYVTMAIGAHKLSKMVRGS